MAEEIFKEILSMQIAYEKSTNCIFARKRIKLQIWCRFEMNKMRKHKKHFIKVIFITQTTISVTIHIETLLSDCYAKTHIHIT